MRRSIRAILMSLFCMLLLYGCGEQEKPEGYAFIDDLGREVTVSTCNRVAPILGSFADVWMLSGGEVVATCNDAWEDLGLNLRDDCINLGGAHSPSFEALFKANPDFVIASASTASNVEMKDALENAGITVAYFDVDCFEDYLRMLDVCTDITGRKDLYEKNGINIKAQIDHVKKCCADAKVPADQNTVLLLRVSSGAVKAKGSRGTVLGEMLCELGCKNIADSDKGLLENLSVESVIKNEPYRIFVVTMGDDIDKAMKNLTETMSENPAWKTLLAVRENRMHFMDRRLFNIKPNVRWAEAYEEPGRILLEE